MSGDRSKIVERIRKLLALADDKGATEAEAVAAVMMAQRLMAENDVADWELHSMDEQPIATAESEPVRRRWRWTLADAISSNFRCRYYQNRKRCAPTGWKTEYRMIFYVRIGREGRSARFRLPVQDRRQAGMQASWQGVQGAWLF